MEQEIWKPLNGFCSAYLISSFGRIKTPDGRIRKYQINYRGYATLKMARFVDGSRKNFTVKVHRLVCAAFHPNPENKPQVNHKDLNQLNNRVSNLEWATAKENTNHAQVNGRFPIKSPKVLKDVFDYQKPVIDLNTGIFYTAAELAGLLNVPTKYISRRLNGERPNTTSYRYA